MGKRSRIGRDERGFALVIAMLTLMLLTFLGLTLAATTSTELQIATNYRWSQQALYNAEAGMEAVRVELAELGRRHAADGTYPEWKLALPALRETAGVPTLWLVDEDPSTPGPPDPVELPGTGRDFWMRDCDERANMGYGRVLDTREMSNPSGQRYENVSTYAGARLNGAFTLWIRRNVKVEDTGQFGDDPLNNAATIVAEGTAPFVGRNDAFAKAHQAIAVLETRISLGIGEASCVQPAGQEGVSAAGTGYNPCAPLFAEDVAGSLEGAFGGAGAGSLEALMVGEDRVE